MVSVGANRRYPGHNIGRAIDAAVTKPRPVTLTEAELDLEHEQVVTPDEPIPARAWVRFHEATIRPDCEVIEYTSRAVRIRWIDWWGNPQTAWVWASAVRGRGD